MTRHQPRHRGSEHPNTIDGDIAFFGLRHTERQHYLDRTWHHKWAHDHHTSHGERRALAYFLTGWITFIAACFTIIFWLVT